MSDVVLQDRVPQIVVGLCRAAASQSKALATLVDVGMASAAAPNRRLVLEAAIRLQWFAGLAREERILATDIMLAKDRRDTNGTLDFVEGLGHGVEFDRTEMNSFVLDAPSSGTLQEQVRKLDAAVKAHTSATWSMYAMWREETKFSHASGALAGQYAPTFDDTRLSSGSPDPMDPTLEAHQIVQFLIAMNTGWILADEGYLPAIADRIPAAHRSSTPVARDWWAEISSAR
jgi:hypothetical protein